MATITNLPSVPTAPLSSLAAGKWCIIASNPGTVYCVFNQVGAFTELALFSGTQDCVRVNLTNTTQATEVPAPTVTLAF